MGFLSWRGWWYLFAWLPVSPGWINPLLLSPLFSSSFLRVSTSRGGLTPQGTFLLFDYTMTNTEVQEPAPAALPDYLTDPDAVLKDAEAKWRYGRAPDYSKTRKFYAESE